MDFAYVKKIMRLPFISSIYETQGRLGLASGCKFCHCAQSAVEGGRRKVSADYCRTDSRSMHFAACVILQQGVGLHQWELCNKQDWPNTAQGSKYLECAQESEAHLAIAFIQIKAQATGKRGRVALLCTPMCHLCHVSKYYRDALINW